MSIPLEERIGLAILQRLEQFGSMDLEGLLGHLAGEFPDLPAAEIARSLTALVNAHRVCPDSNRFTLVQRETCLVCGKAAVILPRAPGRLDD